MNDRINSLADEEIRLDRYFAAVWRAKWLIIIAVIIAAGVTAAVGYRRPTLYTAKALIEVGRVWKEPLEDTYVTAEVANSAGFIQGLAAKLGVKPAHLRRGLRTEPVTAGPRRSRYPILVEITATTESQDEAVGLAQAAAEELTARHEELFAQSVAPRLERQRRLEEQLTDPEMRSSPAMRDLAIKLEADLAEVKSNNTSPTLTEKTHLVEPVAPAAAIKPAFWKEVAVAALLTAIAAILVAALAVHFKPASHGMAAGRQG